MVRSLPLGIVKNASLTRVHVPVRYARIIDRGNSIARASLLFPPTSMAAAVEAVGRCEVTAVYVSGAGRARR